MNVGYTFSWLLPSGDIAQVRDIIAKLRLHAIELGGEVGDMIEGNGDDAQAVLFTATIPGATESRYGLASAGDFSWAWKGSVIVSSMKQISELHGAAALLGIEVVEAFGGMVFTTTKNPDGVVESEQREAFDWTNF